MVDTWESDHLDRTRRIQDALGDSGQNRCVVCHKSTRNQEGAVFCSPGCASKAMNFRGGTYAQRAMRDASRLNRFFATQARFLDGGMWPGQTMKAKARKVADDWKEQM